MADHPEAVDEYDSYLPSIQRELREGSVDSLASYLHALSIEQMGLTRNEADDRHAAEALRAWWAEHSTA